MQEPKFTQTPLHVVDQGRGQFPLVCGERGIIDWVAVINDGPNAVTTGQLFAAAAELYAEADRARLALESAASLLEVAWPAHAPMMREQAAELAKVLAKACGEA